MTPSIESTLGDHGARIANLEEREQSTAEKLDSLRNWIMGTLLTALAGTLGVIGQLLLKK